MPKVAVTLYRLIQDSQEFGSDHEHMVSRVFFRAVCDGRQADGYIQIKQAVGSNSREGRPVIEVSAPRLPGPWNHEVFRQAVQDYFHGLIGSQGMGIRIDRGAVACMWENVFDVQQTFEFEVPGTEASSW